MPLNLALPADLATRLEGLGDAIAAACPGVARAASRHLGTDAVDVVHLNTAPVSLAGRVLLSRRVILDRQPFVRHRYESATIRLFHDFRIREHRILSQRLAYG